MNQAYFDYQVDTMTEIKTPVLVRLPYITFCGHLFSFLHEDKKYLFEMFIQENKISDFSRLSKSYSAQIFPDYLRIWIKQ